MSKIHLSHIRRTYLAVAHHENQCTKTARVCMRLVPCSVSSHYNRRMLAFAAGAATVEHRQEVVQNLAARRIRGLELQYWKSNSYALIGHRARFTFRLSRIDILRLREVSGMFCEDGNPSKIILSSSDRYTLQVGSRRKDFDHRPVSKSLPGA
jgi:hypothetical protein